MIRLTGEVFKTEGIPATLFSLGLLKQFGAQFYNWDPETLWHEIAEAYVITVDDILEENKDTINAICAVNVIDTPFAECDVFRHVVLAMNQNDPQFQSAGGLDPAELAWGLLEMKRNCNKPLPYSEEVKRYVSLCIEHDHFLSVPPAISAHIKFPYKPDISPELASDKDVLLEESIRQKRVDVYLTMKEENLAKLMDRLSR